MAPIIDWSLAPDDATHYEHVNGSRRGTFMRLVANPWMYWSPARQEWCLDKYGHMHESTFIPRPKPTPSWTGIGLPPVGTVCEVLSDLGRWNHCTVLVYHDGNLVFVDEPGVYGALDELHRFRPIRTPEQIAAEEREKAIQDLIRVTCINHGEAARIHDAGYRKVTEAVHG